MAWKRTCARCGTTTKYSNRRCPSCKRLFGSRLIRAEREQAARTVRAEEGIAIDPSLRAAVKEIRRRASRSVRSRQPAKPTGVHKERAARLDLARAEEPAVPPARSVRAVNGGRIESNRRRH